MTKDLYDKLMVFGNDREPFLAHNFMRTTDLDDGTATVTLPMHTESLNRWGGAHGGILFSLCDVAMGMAIMTLRQEMVVTVNATIDYLSAAAAGTAAPSWSARARARAMAAGLLAFLMLFPPAILFWTGSRVSSQFRLV